MKNTILELQELVKIQLNEGVLEGTDIVVILIVIICFAPMYVISPRNIDNNQQ